MERKHVYILIAILIVSLIANVIFAIQLKEQKHAINMYLSSEYKEMDENIRIVSEKVNQTVDAESFGDIGNFLYSTCYENAKNIGCFREVNDKQCFDWFFFEDFVYNFVIKDEYEESEIKQLCANLNNICDEWCYFFQEPLEKNYDFFQDPKGVNDLVIEIKDFTEKTG